MKLLAIAILSINIFNCFAQKSRTDTLIYYREISFNTPDEEKYIRDFFEKNDTNYFALFYFAQPQKQIPIILTPQERFKKLEEIIKTPKFIGLKPEKKIKIIHETVHKQCFTKYELNTTFEKIFSAGVFNCVTGTALYGILLKDLGIPFEIKETENHVYAIAYPNNGNIQLESTDAMQKVFNYNEKFKESWIEYLKNSKLIDQSESMTKSKEELFNNYFYSKTHLSLRDLLGLQYYNNTLSLIDEKNYIEALHQIEKAYVFYPSERVEFALFSTLALAITQTKYDDIKDADLYVKISRFIKRNLTLEMAKGEFGRITQLQLIEKSRLDHYKNIYHSIKDKIQNKDLLNEISSIYNFEIGRYLYNKGERLEARDYFFNALRCKPENSDMQTALIQSITEFTSEIELFESLEKIENYAIEFSFLKENAKICNVLNTCYLALAYQAFQEVEIEKGNAYLQKFEALNKEHTNVYIIGELLINAYSSASAYYYKRNNIKKAREYINRALKIEPNNYYLKNLLRSM